MYTYTVYEISPWEDLPGSNGTARHVPDEISSKTYTSRLSMPEGDRKVFDWMLSKDLKVTSCGSTCYVIRAY